MRKAIARILHWIGHSIVMLGFRVQPIEHAKPKLSREEVERRLREAEKLPPVQMVLAINALCKEDGKVITYPEWETWVMRHLDVLLDPVVMSTYTFELHKGKKS